MVDAVLASTALPAVLDNYKRFVDGGVGTFGNPAYIGTMEALLYSCSPQIDPRTTEPQLDADGQIVLKNDPTYKEDEVDIWSFGTGQVTDHFTARMLKDRKQVDFWLKYLITEGAPRASSEQQNWLLRRHPVLSKHFKRFNLFINEASLSCLGCPKAAPETFTMESVSNAQFAVIDEVGEAFAQHLIMSDAFGKQGGEEFGERTPGGFNIPAYVKGVLSEFANPRL